MESGWAKKGKGVIPYSLGFRGVSCEDFGVISGKVLRMELFNLLSQVGKWKLGADPADLRPHSKAVSDTRSQEV